MIDMPKPMNTVAEKLFPLMNKFKRFVNEAADPDLVIRTVCDEINKLKDDKVSDVGSVIRAIINTCVLGLIPGEAMGHSYFSAFRGEVKLIIGYKGFIELALRSKQIGIVHTPQVVLKGENFRQWSDEQGNHFMHEIPATGRDLTEPNIIGAYVSYTTVTGQCDFTYVPRSELDKIPKRNVWLTNYPAMCLTVPVRRAAKFWRRSTDMARALRISDEIDMGEGPQSCPEAAELPEFESEVNLLRRSLDANWHRLCVENEAQKDLVLGWLLKARRASGEDVRYQTVVGSTQLLEEALGALLSSSKMHAWEEILPLSIRHHEETSATAKQ